MTEAQAKYDALLTGKKYTAEELQETIDALTRNGRVSDVYRPARPLMDDMPDEEEPYP